MLISYGDEIHLQRAALAIRPDDARHKLRTAILIRFGYGPGDELTIFRHVRVKDWRLEHVLDRPTANLRQRGVAGAQTLDTRHTDGDPVRTVLKGIDPELPLACFSQAFVGFVDQEDGPAGRRAGA